MKNVDGRALLKRLQNGEFQVNMDNDVKEFLSVYIQDSSSATEKERSLALKFLLAYNAKFDSLPSDCLASAADTMAHCIKCCQFQNFDDPLFLIKVVYHLISKYGKLVCVREALLLADCIYEEYVFQRENSSSEETGSSTAQMALGLNVVLQNTCIKFEQLSQSGQEQIVFSSRILGLQFLVFSRKNLATFAHKLSSVFEKVPATAVADIKPRIDTFLTVLSDELSRDVNNMQESFDIESLYTVELFCCIFHFLFRNHEYQLARETVTQMRKHLKAQKLSKLLEKRNQDTLRLAADILEKIVQNKETFADHRTLKDCVEILEQISRLDGLSCAVVRISSLLCDICLSVTNCTEQKKLMNYDEQDLVASLGLMDCRFTFCVGEWQFLKIERNEVDETNKKMQLDLIVKLISIKTNKLRTVLCLIHLNKSGVSQFSDGCVSELKELETFISQATKETRINISHSERLSLGKISYKWGSQLWFTGQYVSAIDVLLVSVRQLKICAADDAKNVNTQMQIWKVYDLLSNSYRKAGRMSEAMNAVTDGLLADADNLASAAKLWVKIHSDQTNNSADGDNSVQTRTLASALKGCMAKSGKVFSPIVILQEELKASKSARTPAHTYYQKVLEELIFSVKDDPVLKASVLLEKVFFVRSQRADGLCSAKVLCQEATEILEGTRGRSVKGQDLLARTHICLYAINEPDQLDELLKGNSQNKIPKSNPAPQTALNDEDEESEDEVFAESSRAVWYADNQKLLKRALELWDSLYGQDDSARKAYKDVLDVGVTLEYMQIMAVIFKLMQNFVSLSRSLVLLLRISSELKDHRCQLWAFREQVEMHLALRQPAAAEQVFTEVDTWAAQENVSLQQFGRLYVEYLLAKVETYLVVGKRKEAAVILADAKEMKLQQFKEKTKDFLIISGIIMMTESRMALLPLEQRLGSGDDGLVKNPRMETQLETAVRGMRSFISMIFFLFRERNVSGSDSLIDRWAILDLLVRSLIYTGRCYLRTGDGREAKFYLQQGLRFCEAFCLRKRFCEFHLVLAQLSTLSDRFDDCDAHLYHVGTLLSAEGKRVSGKQLSVLSPNVSSRTKPSEVQQDDSDDFLKTKLLKLNLQTVKKKDLGSSPTPKAQETVLPKSWDHEVGCDCAECTDLSLQVLWMSLLIVESNSSLRQRKQDCAKLALHILKNQKKLELQASHVFAKFQLGKPSENGSKDKKPASKKVTSKRSNKKEALPVSEAVSKFYNLELVRIHLLLSESAVVEQEMLALNKHLDSVFRLLSEDHLPGSDDKSILRAQALYLSSLVTFSWPKTDEMAAISHIDWICSGIGRKRMEEDISAGKIVAKTPKPSRRGLSSSKMTATPVADDVAGSALSRAPVKKKTMDKAVKAVPAAPSRRKPKQVSWKLEKELAEIPRTSCVVERSVSRAVEKLSLDDMPSVDESDTLQLSTVRYNRGDYASLSPTKDLLDAFFLLHHDPSTFLYRQVSHGLAVSSMKEQDSIGAAFYLSEAQAVAFRHNCQVIVSKKLSKISDGGSGEPASGLVKSSDTSSTRRQLTELKAMMTFGRTKDDFESNLNMMPEDWAVCQLSVIKPVGQAVGKLYATRFQHGAKPVTVNLPGYSTNECTVNTTDARTLESPNAVCLLMTYEELHDTLFPKVELIFEGQKLFAEFELIMRENQNSMLISQKAEWWKLRQKLDEKLQDLVMNLEQQWLGCWKGMMLGVLTNDDDKKRLKSAATKFLDKIGHPSGDEQLVQCLLSAAHLLSDREIVHALRIIVDADLEIDVIRQQMEIVQRMAKELNLGICNRECVMLILDKDVQHFPWESLPFLESFSVTRVPSVQFLLAHLNFLRTDAASVMNAGVDREKAYYVVNPDQNLSSTQQTFEAWFQSLPGWTGVVSRQPTADELSTALTTKDLYVYCGHGSGNRYLSNESLQMLLCRPTVLLMGCSSGRLLSSGDFEASGVMLSYCLSGCPCIVGNLWDVTDRDIDRYLESLLKTWFSGNTNDLMNTRQSSRLACRFKYLIGAAPIVYGFPVHIKRK